MAFHCGTTYVDFHFCTDKKGTIVGEPILSKKFSYRPADRVLREIIVAHLKGNPELSEKALREYFVMMTVGYKARLVGSFLDIYDRAVLFSPIPRDEQMRERQTSTPLE